MPARKGCIGIMEQKMETTGFIGVVQGLGLAGLETVVVLSASFSSAHPAWQLSLKKVYRRLCYSNFCRILKILRSITQDILKHSFCLNSKGFAA